MGLPSEIPTTSGSVAEIEPANVSRLPALRQLLATLLSAACPGLGHFMLNQLSKGMVLSALFAVLLCGFWPLRFLRYYAGFIVLFLGWIVLGLYSACSTQLIRSPNTGRRPSKRWFAITLPASFLIISLIGAGATRASGFRNFSVPSTSMEPTIERGDRIVVDTHAFRSGAPQYRDVIVFYKDGTFFIKRIIAIAGDTVEGRDNRIIVDGNLVNESYIRHSQALSASDWEPLGNDWMRSFGPFMVPADNYFVMGDNRNLSLDSRSPEFGFVKRGSIIGKVLYVYSAAREGSRVR